MRRRLHSRRGRPRATHSLLWEVLHTGAARVAAPPHTDAELHLKELHEVATRLCPAAPARRLGRAARSRRGRRREGRQDRQADRSVLRAELLHRHGARLGPRQGHLQEGLRTRQPRVEHPQHARHQVPSWLHHQAVHLHARDAAGAEGHPQARRPPVRLSALLPQGHGSKVTLHQLLNHTSGIPSYTDDPKFFSPSCRATHTPPTRSSRSSAPETCGSSPAASGATTTRATSSSAPSWSTSPASRTTSCSSRASWIRSA